MSETKVIWQKDRIRVVQIPPEFGGGFRPERLTSPDASGYEGWIASRWHSEWVNVMLADLLSQIAGRPDKVGCDE